MNNLYSDVSVKVNGLFISYTLVVLFWVLEFFMIVNNKGTGCPEKLENSGWNIFEEEVSFPVAVVDQKALESNLAWMSEFATNSNVKLAPHGKTTMCPDLFKMQIKQGAWAISLATVPQVMAAINAGIQRVILANQLVGKYHFQLISNAIKTSDIEFYCFVDSVENANSLGAHFSSENVNLNIIIEAGVSQGRCGLRDLQKIKDLIFVCKKYTALNICGLGFYEGVITGSNAEGDIESFITHIVKTAIELNDEQLFDIEKPIITGAGSAWYDVVSSVLTKHAHAEQFTNIIRPGCYLIHDTGIYEDAQNKVLSRNGLACDVSGSLESSLSIWAYVISKPESGMAIIGMGKRDVAFDAGLPTPEAFYSIKNKTYQTPCSSLKVTKIMDQHCMLEGSEEAFDNISVGDLIRFSTSHPCLTFDKWKEIGIVENGCTITGTIKTYF